MTATESAPTGKAINEIAATPKAMEKFFSRFTNPVDDGFEYELFYGHAERVLQGFVDARTAGQQQSGEALAEVVIVMRMRCLVEVLTLPLAEAYGLGLEALDAPQLRGLLLAEAAGFSLWNLAEMEFQAEAFLDAVLAARKKAALSPGLQGGFP